MSFEQDMRAMIADAVRPPNLLLADAGHLTHEAKPDGNYLWITN